MKIGTRLILALLCAAFFLTACGRDTAEAGKAEEALQAALTAVQTWDTAAMQRCFTEDVSARFSLGGAAPDGREQEVQKLLLGGMTWQIRACDADGETAAASVEITNKDMAQAMQVFVGALMGVSPEDGAADEQYLSLLRTSIEDDAVPMLTKTVSVTLRRTADEWKVEPTDDLADALTGGLLSYAKGTDEAPAQLRAIRDRVNETLLPLVTSVPDAAAMETLAREMAQKMEYDTYLVGLDDTYDAVLTAWENLSGEIDRLYAQILDGAAGETDTAQCLEYAAAFDEAVAALPE